MKKNSYGQYLLAAARPGVLKFSLSLWERAGEGGLKAIPTAIPEVLIIEPKVFGDARGFFYESWNQRAFDQLVGREVRFVQDNHSASSRNVLRGLHYQMKNVQGKLVRAAAGEVYDVVVDMRRSSPTFGRWVGERLSAANQRMLWVPEGFAHGFVVLSERAEFLYKTTDYYAPGMSARCSERPETCDRLANHGRRF